MKALFISTVTIVISLSLCIADNSDDTKIDAFQRWFAENGGIADGLGITDFPDMGRGILATKNIEIGQDTLFIPSNLIISSSRAQNSDDSLHRKLSTTFSNDDELVISFLLLEKARGDSSFWKPYLDVLPVYVPNLGQFSKTELLELQSPDFVDHVMLSWHKIANNFKFFRNKAASFWPFDLNNITMQDYVWASSIVDSRGFRFQGSINLAPYSDMFNYAPHPDDRQSNSGNFFLQHHKLTKKGLQVSADRACPAGGQLMEDYGDNSDKIYLQYHGFVPDANPFRCHSLSAAGAEAGASEAAREFLKALQFKHSPVKCVDQTGALGQSLEIYLTALAFNEDEISDCNDVMSNSKKNWVMIMDMCGFRRVSETLSKVVEASKKNSKSSRSVLTNIKSGSLEDRVVIQIRAMLRRTSRSFPTSAAEDEAILSSLSSELSSLLHEGGVITADSKAGSMLRMINAVRYRLSVKRLLDTVCAVYGATDCFEDSTTPRTTHQEEQHSIDERRKETLEDVWASPANDSQLERHLQAFNDWFNSGIVPPAVNSLAARLIPGFRIGTVATRHIDREELYLSVPGEMIIDLSLARRDKSFGQLLFDLERKFNGRRDQFHELLLFLIHEAFVKGSDSEFWPYLRLLPSPKDMDLPLLWEDEDVHRRLGPSFIADNVRNYRTTALRNYRAVSKVDLIEAFFGSGVFTLERYLWANAILDSRSIWWHGSRHLVPMLDFVNCNERLKENGELGRVHATEWGSLPESNDKQYALTKAAWTYEEGDQVFENYGQPSHTYFMYHGFMLIPSEYDCVHFVLSISDSERAAIDWQRAQPLVQRLNLRARSGSDRVPTISFCLKESMHWEDIPSNVWMYLGLKMNMFSASGEVEEMSPRARNLLLDIVREQLEQYEEFENSDHDNSNRFLRNEELIMSRWVSLVTSSAEAESKSNRKITGEL